MSGVRLAWKERSFAGVIGVARRDITPPTGIYARNWGAAPADTAVGVHRPLTCTVLTIRTAQDPGFPLVLAAIDAGWFRGPEGATYLRDRVCRELGLASERLMLALSHTHSGPSISPAEIGKPGGRLIGPYLADIGEAVVSAAREAMDGQRPAVMTFAMGRCGIATDRDLPDPDEAARPEEERERRFVCGFNPGAPADDACLVVRVAERSDGRTIATIVNYACHPTTLGPGNRLISPDFVGAMREVVESHTGGAPCLFLQGASGELAPRHQYVSEVSIADQVGRAIGHAALAALNTMLPVACGLEYAGVVESGARLANWRTFDFEPSDDLEAAEVAVEVPLKESLRSEQAIAVELVGCADRARCERLHREALVVRTVGSGRTARRPVWFWRLGDAMLIGHADEAYSQMQRDLRAAFPENAVLVMNVVNGWGGYLCPESLYDHRLYQVQQSPYARGGLEALICQCTRAARVMFCDPTTPGLRHD